MVSLKLKQLLIIEWIDSCSIGNSQWNGFEDAEELTPEYCTSVGWVLKETDLYITIVPHSTELSIKGEVCIPKYCIINQIELEVPKRKK